MSFKKKLLQAPVLGKSITEPIVHTKARKPPVGERVIQHDEQGREDRGTVVGPGANPEITWVQWGDPTQPGPGLPSFDSDLISPAPGTAEHAQKALTPEQSRDYREAARTARQQYDERDRDFIVHDRYGGLKTQAEFAEQRNAVAGIQSPAGKAFRPGEVVSVRDEQSYPLSDPNETYQARVFSDEGGEYIRLADVEPYPDPEKFSVPIVRTHVVGHSTNKSLEDVSQIEASVCAECAAPATSRCRCQLGSQMCDNGHSWYFCPQHPTVRLPGNGHGNDIGFDRCHCAALEAQMMMGQMGEKGTRPYNPDFHSSGALHGLDREIVVGEGQEITVPGRETFREGDYMGGKEGDHDIQRRFGEIQSEDNDDTYVNPTYGQKGAEQHEEGATVEYETNYGTHLARVHGPGTSLPDGHVSTRIQPMGVSLTYDADPRLMDDTRNLPPEDAQSAHYGKNFKEQTVHQQETSRQQTEIDKKEKESGQKQGQQSQGKALTEQQQQALQNQLGIMYEQHPQGSPAVRDGVLKRGLENREKENAGRGIQSPGEKKALEPGDEVEIRHDERGVPQNRGVLVENLHDGAAHSVRTRTLIPGCEEVPPHVHLGRNAYMYQDDELSPKGKHPAAGKAMSAIDDTRGGALRAPPAMGVSKKRKAFAEGDEVTVEDDNVYRNPEEYTKEGAEHYAIPARVTGRGNQRHYHVATEHGPIFWVESGRISRVVPKGDTKAVRLLYRQKALPTGLPDGEPQEAPQEQQMAPEQAAPQLPPIDPHAMLVAEILVTLFDDGVLSQFVGESPANSADSYTPDGKADAVGMGADMRKSLAIHIMKALEGNRRIRSVYQDPDRGSFFNDFVQRSAPDQSGLHPDTTRMEYQGPDGQYHDHGLSHDSAIAYHESEQIHNEPDAPGTNPPEEKGLGDVLRGIGQWLQDPTGLREHDRNIQEIQQRTADTIIETQKEDREFKEKYPEEKSLHAVLADIKGWLGGKSFRPGDMVTYTEEGYPAGDEFESGPYLVTHELDPDMTTLRNHHGIRPSVDPTKVRTVRDFGRDIKPG